MSLKTTRNPDIISLIAIWGKTQPGLKAVIYRGNEGGPYSRLAQFYSAEGYNNYKRTNAWLASIVHDQEGIRIWGPDSYGDGGGTPRDPEGGKAKAEKIYWLKPADPEFFNKLKKVLFRFHRKEKKR